jgi:hypothetical protein
MAATMCPGTLTMRSCEFQSAMCDIEASCRPHSSKVHALIMHVQQLPRNKEFVSAAECFWLTTQLQLADS